MPLVSKETQVGMPVDSQEKALLGTPGSDTALANLQASDAASHGPNGVPEQSRAERKTSFDPADFAVPNGREEEWRFTPVDRLRALFADGEGTGHLDWQSRLPEPVTSQTISAQKARELTVMTPADRPAALAFARSGGAIQIDIPNDADVTEPIRIDLRGQGADPAVFGHIVVTAGRHSRATLVLAHAGDAQYAELLSVVTGDGADLTVVSLQEWDDEALHLAQQDLLVGRDATVRHIAVTLGGKVVRMCVNASYAGPGGSFQGLGVYFADSGQDLEHRLFVDHEAPRCVSDVEYKGALPGRPRTPCGSATC